MTTPSSSIRVQCPNCGAVARGKASHLKRDLKCPKCEETVRFRALTEQAPQQPSSKPNVETPPATPPPRESTRASSALVESRDEGASAASSGRDDSVTEDNTDYKDYVAKASQEFGNPELIVACVAGFGLLLLGLSPLFKWVNLGAGGATGLVGDGKILLAATVIAAVAYAVATIKHKWVNPIVLTVQALGTLAVFWMGTLIWKVGSVFDAADLEENPFAALLATQISPGAGLYIGLCGGLIVAGALGVLAVRFLLTDNLKPFYASQSVACVLGVILVFFVGHDRAIISNENAVGLEGSESAPADDRAEVESAREAKRRREEEQENAAEAAYISQNVELYDVAATYRESMLDGKIPGVTFKLRNNGDKSLDKVEVTVYFKDAGGNVIAEDSYLPVFVSEYSLGENKPLKPGYVWQMERGRFYSAKSVPTEWQEGSFNATVTEIEFAVLDSP